MFGDFGRETKEIIVPFLILILITVAMCTTTQEFSSSTTIVSKVVTYKDKHIPTESTSWPEQLANPHFARRLCILILIVATGCSAGCGLLYLCIRRIKRTQKADHIQQMEEGDSTLSLTSSNKEGRTKHKINTGHGNDCSKSQFLNKNNIENNATQSPKLKQYFYRAFSRISLMKNPVPDDFQT